ncbi:MAG: septal ring lytic transglycosylase RlpA family protein [Treponema sp.]|jgi:rare lipoprotein A|nr:septal ring lytic transglycosylase RlpA family protein [Treponema sp.]
MKRIIAIIIISLGAAIFGIAQTQQNTGNDSFRQEGIASWYGPEFDGHPTASGEIFDSSLMTAAHPSLPFGTQLRITNKHNNKQVLVRVNDRGPFVSARIIDLSKAAAEQLDMITTGTAPVILESLSLPTVVTEDAPQGSAEWERISSLDSADTMGYISAAPVISQEIIPPPAPVTSPAAAEVKGGIPPAGTGKLYRIQVGAYKIARNAVDAFDRLKNGGLNPAYEQNGEFYRVVLAGIRAEDVSSIAEKLGAVGFQEVFIREEP